MSDEKTKDEPKYAQPRTVVLRHPIEIGSQRIESLTFRPPTGKDFRQLPEGDMDVTLALAGRLSGQTDAVIDRLQAEDLWEVLAVVGGFGPGGRAIGNVP